MTGANAHDLHSLLGNYHELCLLAAEDDALMARVRRIEGRLRAFCHTGELADKRVAPIPRTSRSSEGDDVDSTSKMGSIFCD